MALKKPSEYFKKNIATVNDSVQELVKSPELNTFSDAFESFKNNLSKIEVLSEFSDTLDNYRVNIERVNHLSKSVEDIQTEIQNLLKKEDLDRAMMSQLLVVEQSIRDVQNKVKGINEKNLTEIRLDVSGLTQSVNEFLEVEVPQYKRLIVDSELRTDNRFTQLEENVNQTLEGIGEFVDNKYQELTETLQGINEQSLAGILEDFKVLGNIVQEFKEQDIPKYKGFIVETETKTENKLNEFQEKLDETVSNILEKVSSIDVDNTDLIDIINQKIEDVNKLSKQVRLTEQSTEDYKNQIKKKVSDLEVDILRNETHIRVQNKNLKAIQEEVKETLGKINLQELENQNHKLGKKIKYLEEVFEKFSEKEILTENIIVEPPSTDNKDPLTPLDQNFVTLDQLQQHYRLFINRIQQQLATIGGGGETRLEFLDDVDRNSAKTNGYVLQYDSSVGKFIGTSYVPGGGGNVAIAVTNVAPTDPEEGNLWYDLDIGRTFIYYTDIDGSQWVDANPSGSIDVGLNVYDNYPTYVGIVTAVDFGDNLTVSPISSGIVTVTASGGGFWVDANPGIYTTGNVAIGTDVVGSGSTALWVQGDARITGILSVGQGTVTIDGITNTVNVDNLIVGTTLTGPSGVGYATEGYVTQQITNLVDGAPGALDTLNELAAALNDDENFATTVTNSLALKANINNASFTGITTTQTLNVGVGGTIITTTGIGSVGIGTTQPGSTLVVNAPSGYTGDLFKVRINSVDTFTLQNYTVSGGWTPFKVGGNNGAIVYYNNSPVFTFHTGKGIQIINGPLSFAAGFAGQVGDLQLYRDAANTLAQRNGTNAQTSRIYNTYTSSTNFERAQVGWTTNTFIVGTEKGSAGGSPRQLELQTDGTTRVAITTDGYVGIGSTQPTATLDVNGTATFTDTRLNSVSEESVIGTGNTISLVYNTGGGNIGIITSPSGPITLNITGIPTDSSFDNRVLTFSVMVNQGVTGYACSTVTLNGVSATVKYPGAVVSTGSTSAYDIFNFTCINPVGSASTTSNYVVLGMVNGNFK